MADPARKGQVLDEDDEFEDFAQEDWEPGPEELKRKALWDRSWDDDSLDDHVGQQLRQHLPKVGSAAAAAAQGQPQPQQ